MNERNGKSTLKETEKQRNTNFSKNNNIQRNMTNRKSMEKEYGKNIFAVGDNHIKRINRRRFNNLFEKVKSFVSFLGAKTEELEHYVVPHLNAQKPDISVIHIVGNNINFRVRYK